MALIQNIALTIALAVAASTSMAQSATNDTPAKDTPTPQAQMDCDKAGQRHDHVAERAGSGSSMAHNCASPGTKSADAKKMPRHDHGKVHKGQ